MPTVFSTATVAAIAQAAQQFTERLTALEEEAAGIRRILAILNDGNAPTEEAAERRALGGVINTRVRRALAAVQEAPTSPAPAVAELTAWGKRKAREAERAAEREGRRAARKAAKAARRNPKAGKRPPVKNAEPLPAVLAGILERAGAPMATADLAAAALASGYVTSSENFRNVVHMGLTHDRRNRFRRLRDGNWTLNAKAAANG